MHHNVDYNLELWNTFINNTLSYIETLNPIPKKDKAESLDLLRSISSYRDYKNKEDLLKAFPDLSCQIQYIDLLWKHFDGLTEEELSDLAIEMIHDVSPTS